MNAILPNVNNEVEKNTPSEQIARFWSEYRKALNADGRLESRHSDWYVKRAQQFVERTRHVRLRSQTAEDLIAYLVQVAARWNLQEWQYIQIVDALRVLFTRMVKTSWANDFPWSKWKEPHLNFPDELERYSGLAERAEWRPPVAGTERFKDTAAGLKAVDFFKEDFNRLRKAVRARHYSIRTEQTYEDWVIRFLAFNDYRPLQSLGGNDVRLYLEYLADVRRVSASSQNQCLCALVFLYEHGLKLPLGQFGDFTRAKRPQRIPVVLSKDEVRRLFEQIDGTYGLMAGLLYGAGLRLMECVRLRVKDIDFDRISESASVNAYVFISSIRFFTSARIGGANEAEHNSRSCAAACRAM
jgi:site-specific recombinase XerD